MVSKSKMDSMEIKLANQLKGVASIGYISKTSNAIERLMWITIAISGTILVWQTFIIQMKDWNDFPILKTKETLDLSQMPSPAVTFCPKMLSEFSVDEGLGNHLDLDKKPLPSEVIVIRNEAVKLYWENRVKKIGCNMSWTQSMVTSLANYHEKCCQGKMWCKVCIFSIIIFV